MFKTLLSPRAMFGDVTAEVAIKYNTASNAVITIPAATKASVLVLEKPKPFIPVKPVLEDLSQYEEYERLAEEIGYTSNELSKAKRTRILAEEEQLVQEFFLDNGLPMYNGREVATFMDKLVANLPENVNMTESDKEWRRNRGGKALAVEWQWCDFVPQDSYQRWIPAYTKTIPIAILRRASVIKKQFPTVTFQVTDYVATNPDPFIKAQFSFGSIIFGVWDEPGFGNLSPKDKDLNTGK